MAKIFYFFFERERDREIERERERDRYHLYIHPTIPPRFPNPSLDTKHERMNNK